VIPMGILSTWNSWDKLLLRKEKTLEKPDRLTMSSSEDLREKRKLRA